MKKRYVLRSNMIKMNTNTSVSYESIEGFSSLLNRHLSNILHVLMNMKTIYCIESNWGIHLNGLLFFFSFMMQKVPFYFDHAQYLMLLMFSIPYGFNCDWLLNLLCDSMLNIRFWDNETIQNRLLSVMAIL